MNETTPIEFKQPGFLNRSSSILGIFACMGIFIVIIVIAYLPNRPRPVEQGIIDERIKRLSSLNAKETETYNSYGWIDKPAGIVHIPVESAIDAFVKDPTYFQKLSIKQSSVPKPVVVPITSTTSTSPQNTVLVPGSVKDETITPIKATTPLPITFSNTHKT